MTLNKFLSTINTECQYNIKCGINTYSYNEKTSIPQKYQTMKIESVQIKIKQVLIHYITAHTDKQTQTNYYMPTLRNIRLCSQHFKAIIAEPDVRQPRQIPLKEMEGAISCLQHTPS